MAARFVCRTMTSSMCVFARALLLCMFTCRWVTRTQARWTGRTHRCSSGTSKKFTTSGGQWLGGGGIEGESFLFYKVFPGRRPSVAKEACLRMPHERLHPSQMPVFNQPIMHPSLACLCIYIHSDTHAIMHEAVHCVQRLGPRSIVAETFGAF